MLAGITKKKEFTPLVLNITIQSERELQMLLCCFNNSLVKFTDFVNKGNTYNFEPFTNQDCRGSEPIWKALTYERIQ